jgi:hypothetical protein
MVRFVRTILTAIAVAGSGMEVTGGGAIFGVLIRIATS